MSSERDLGLKNVAPSNTVFIHISRAYCCCPAENITVNVYFDISKQASWNSENITFNDWNFDFDSSFKMSIS